MTYPTDHCFCLSLRILKAGFPLSAEATAMRPAHIIHIIGLCLWLAAGSSGCGVLDNVTSVELCIRNLVDKVNMEPSEHPMRSRQYLSGLLSNELDESMFEGTQWQWSLSKYNFENHDNYNIEDVAVRKEGNTLNVTFSVRWRSPVVVGVSARQDGSRPAKIDCLEIWTESQVCQKYFDCEYSEWEKCPKSQACVLSKCENSRFVAVKGHVNGLVFIAIDNMAGEGGVIRYHTDSLYNRDFSEKEKYSNTIVTGRVQLTKAMDQLDTSMGDPSTKLRNALIPKWKLRIRIYMKRVILVVNSYVRGLLDKMKKSK